MSSRGRVGFLVGMRLDWARLRRLGFTGRGGEEAAPGRLHRTLD